MATTAISRLFAALAAVSILASCGGGSDAVPQAKTQSDPFVGTAVQGTFDGATRRQALASSEASIRPVFSVTSRVTQQVAAVKAQSLAAAGEGSLGPTPDQLFDWAEGRYPDLFPGHQVTRNGEYDGVNYDFRGYPVTGGANHIGVAKSGPDVGGIYGIGPFTGHVLVRFGTDLDFRCQVDPVSCGPKLVSAKLVNMLTGASIDAGGATGALAKNTKLVLTYDELSCVGVGGTGVVGTLVMTISCTGSTVTFVPGIPGEERWTFGSDVTVTASGLRNVAGYPSAEVSVTWSTQPFTSTKVFVGNGAGFTDHRDVSMIDRSSGAAIGLVLSGPNDSNQFIDGHFAASRVAGVLYAAPNVTGYIYRLDAATGEALTPLPIYRGAVQGDPIQGVQGVASSEQHICAVLGRLTLQSIYAWRNVLMCWDHFTLEKVFESPVDFVTDSTKIAFDLYYSNKNKRFYAINGTEAAVYIEEYQYQGYRYRDGFKAGTPGTVTEVNCETIPCKVSKTYQVGSVPRGISEDPATGTLYVTNSGDKSLSVITPSSGQVVTRALPNFTGWQVPVRVLYDAGRLLVGDYMSDVAVMNPTTLAEVGRIETGNVPMGMAVVGDEIWVALPWNVLTGLSDQVAVLDRSTLAVKRKLTDVGKFPWVVTAP